MPILELAAAIAEVAPEVAEGISEVGKMEQELNSFKKEVGSYLKELGKNEISNLKKELSKEEVSQLNKEAAADNKEKTENEKGEKKGGSYKDVRVAGEGDTKEVHHMPSDESSPLERNDGPCIKMDKEDHRKTASCGNSREAREYRQQQKELIESGRFRDAIQMDIDDIKEKFGDKYDDAIAEMMEYVDQLEQEGRI